MHRGLKIHPLQAPPYVYAAVLAITFSDVKMKCPDVLKWSDKVRIGRTSCNRVFGLCMEWCLIFPSNQDLSISVIGLTLHSSLLLLRKSALILVVYKLDCPPLPKQVYQAANHYYLVRAAAYMAEILAYLQKISKLTMQ